MRALLDSCGSVLGWDERTYMPRQGSAHRAEQMALLARLTHEMLTAPHIGDLLAAVGAVAPWSRTPTADDGGQRPRDSPRLRPGRQAAQGAGRGAGPRHDAGPAGLAGSPPGQRLRRLPAVAGKDRPPQAPGSGGHRLPGIALRRPARRVRARRHHARRSRASSPPCARTWCRWWQPSWRPANGRGARSSSASIPVDRQQVFGEAAAAAIGFDFAAGRLDATTHPFCSGIGPGDCRITTRYNPRHFNESFFGILHEAGHGIYEQGLDPEHFGTPLGSAARWASTNRSRGCGRTRSAAAGRSGSTSSPRPAGCSRPPWATLRLDDFVFAINDVQPSFIRVEADEATYNMHIILRFELEQALISGDLQPADVPGGVEREVQEVVRADAAERRQGLSAGHPLEHGRHRLFPDVHARQPVRGPVHGAGAAATWATWTATSAAASSAG